MEGQRMAVTVVVPTYNERENMEPLIRGLDEALRDLGYEVVVVDDNSPDGTAEEARRLAEKYPVRVVVRPGRMGLASAVVRGAAEARHELVIVMDADLQHPPRVARLLALAAMLGYDIVVASRYTRGGGVEGWNALRHIASRGGTLLTRMLVPPARRSTDPLSGFFAARRRLLLDPGLRVQGFKILLELLARNPSARVRDVPYVFRPRSRGASKLSIGIVWAFASQLLRLLVESRRV